MDRETGIDDVKVSLTEDQGIDPGARQSIQSYISGLTVPNKVELAVKGNREVRLILSRDPNKMVARAVFTSPRVSPGDILDYVLSPLTNEDLLREIGLDKGLMSNPQIMKAVVSNPQTPVSVAIRFLPRLPRAELNLLSRNRNINAFLRREAKRLAIRGC